MKLEKLRLNFLRCANCYVAPLITKQQMCGECLLQRGTYGKGALDRIVKCYLTNTEMQQREHKTKFLTTF